MKYKLPDHGFAKFLLHRGKRKLGVWIIPGKSIELDASDVASLQKIGIVPTPEATSKPKRPKQEIISPPAPVPSISEPAGSQSIEREASRIEDEKPADSIDDDAFDLDGELE